MLVAVDKFTKWVEAKPINSQDAASAVKFIKSIVFRFGVPHSIVTDNGSNFTSKEFKAYCAEVGIKLHFALVAHRKPMAKSRKQTASYAMASRNVYWRHSKKQGTLGSTSYPPCYGACEQHQMQQLKKHLSFWSMALKLCFRWN